jgi:hypothetical protein
MIAQLIAEGADLLTAGASTPMPPPIAPAMCWATGC